MPEAISRFEPKQPQLANAQDAAKRPIRSNYLTQPRFISHFAATGSPPAVSTLDRPN